MTAICQRCGAIYSDWTVRQAEFHVGQLRHWKVQLCQECAEKIEKVVSSALRTQEVAP